MKWFWLLALELWFFLGASRVLAIYDPLSVPNNRMGVHILEPSEIEDAAKLVNSSGGSWGYVTIPVRSDDRDPVKWRRFFLRAGQLHVIPIIRLATYPYGGTWAAPTAFDLVDFANFLSDMPWPTQNRYVILFNEPNHAAEWGGSVDPAAYAALLEIAKDIFSTRSADYFLLTAGLDMSAPTNHTSKDALLFWRQVTAAAPHWSESIDGYAFHAYPNPAFSAPPTHPGRFGLASYTYELRILPPKPYFITETGHLGQPDFYTVAMTSVWTDSRLVAVTPFLLYAGSGDFTRFSLLDQGHQPTASYRDLTALPKSAGSPLLSAIPLPAPTRVLAPPAPPPYQSLPFLTNLHRLLSPPPSLQPLTIGSSRLTVEIAATDASRTQGLSDRDALPPDTGMLFVYPAPIKPVFWMHGMRFALDFVWINRGQVVGLTPDIPPPSQTGGQPAVIQPDLLAEWILEVPAGFIASHDIKVRDEVVLSP